MFYIYIVVIKMQKIKCYIFTLFLIMSGMHVLDIRDKLFIIIFDGLNENYKKDLHAINNQYIF